MTTASMDEMFSSLMSDPGQIRLSFDLDSKVDTQKDFSEFSQSYQKPSTYEYDARSSTPDSRASAPSLFGSSNASFSSLSTPRSSTSPLNTSVKSPFDVRSNFQYSSPNWQIHYDRLHDDQPEPISTISQTPSDSSNKHAYQAYFPGAISSHHEFQPPDSPVSPMDTSISAIHTDISNSQPSEDYFEPQSNDTPAEDSRSDLDSYAGATSSEPLSPDSQIAKFDLVQSRSSMPTSLRRGGIPRNPGTDISRFSRTTGGYPSGSRGELAESVDTTQQSIQSGVRNLKRHYYEAREIDHEVFTEGIYSHNVAASKSTGWRREAVNTKQRNTRFGRLIRPDRPSRLSVVENADRRSNTGTTAVSMVKKSLASSRNITALSGFTGTREPDAFDRAINYHREQAQKARKSVSATE
ncbi:uncharacterized protein L201_001726 [Kwoniella dendrophila CBS 6074]|uniref:Uncharacterized protein n=1 Tax=Kwoniella dendrophila CBS 6074 TaxID=1295534 RepID=A0AAX4JPU3_9TREE